MNTLVQAHVQDNLRQLEHTALIHPAALMPMFQYLFRHGLIQEAAYETLHEQDRCEVHRAVGEVLEQTYPDQREGLAGTLARHFSLGDDRQKAADYYRLAADQAMRRNAHLEAEA